MDEKKTTMERTERNILAHLKSLNDEIDGNGGEIRDHMVLDGIKDCLKCLKYLKVMGL